MFPVVCGLTLSDVLHDTEVDNVAAIIAEVVLIDKLLLLLVVNKSLLCVYDEHHWLESLPESSVRCLMPRVLICDIVTISDSMT